jgi:hypothetical protein
MGDTLAKSRHINKVVLAEDLARFLLSLQSTDVAGGPPAGEHGFYRGGSLSVYDAQMRKAVILLKDKVGSAWMLEWWKVALATQWYQPSVWVRGDVSAGSLLGHDGKLSLAPAVWAKHMWLRPLPTVLLNKGFAPPSGKLWSWFGGYSRYASQDLEMPEIMAKLASIYVLILDDIVYVKKQRPQIQLTTRHPLSSSQTYSRIT